MDRGEVRIDRESGGRAFTVYFVNELGYEEIIVKAMYLKGAERVKELVEELMELRHEAAEFWEHQEEVAKTLVTLHPEDDKLAQMIMNVW